MKYVKPMVVMNEEMAEGVFAGSGDCYSVKIKPTQKPEGGRQTYLFQMDATHEAKDGHHSQVRTVVVVFSNPVNYIKSGAASVEGSGTSSLTLTFKDGFGGAYHNNATDNIGLGSLEVSAVNPSDTIEALNIFCTYCNRDCEQHPQ